MTGLQQLPYFDIATRGQVFKRFKGGIALAGFDSIQHRAADASGQAELKLVQPRLLPLTADILRKNMLDARVHDPECAGWAV